MTTLALLRQATLNVLYGLDDFEYPSEDRINGAIADGTTETVAFDTAALWDADDWVEYQDNGEVTKLVSDTVQKRAQRGTTGASHADNVTVLRNPAFPWHRVDAEIQAIVRSELWPHVWTWHKDTVNVADTSFRYELDEYIDEVVVCYQDDIDSNGRTRFLPPGWWDTERQVATSIATNGGLLIVKKVYDYDEDLHIVAKRRPHVDDLANLSDEIADLVPFAAAARCVAFRSPQVKAAAHRAEQRSDSTLLQDYRALRADFLVQRDQLHRLLVKEVRPDMRHRPLSRAFRRSW